jgi:hypothetical protein
MEILRSEIIEALVGVFHPSEYELLENITEGKFSTDEGKVLFKLYIN